MCGFIPDLEHFLGLLSGCEYIYSLQRCYCYTQRSNNLVTRFIFLSLCNFNFVFVILLYLPSHFAKIFEGFIYKTCEEEYFQKLL